VLESRSVSSVENDILVPMDLAEELEPGQLNFNSLERLLGFNLGNSYAALSFDLDPALRLMDLNPGVTQSQLARLFRMRRATIHQMIASLTRKELLVLESSEADRRAQGLFITDAGREKLGQARGVVRG